MSQPPGPQYPPPWTPSAPVPGSPYALPAGVPLPPSPLGLGAIITAAVAIYAKRPFALMWLGMLVGASFQLDVIVSFLTSWIPGLPSTAGRPVADFMLALVLWSVGVTVAVAVAPTMVIVCQDALDGRPPSLSDAWGRTRGVLPRSLGLIVALIVGYAVLMGGLRFPIDQGLWDTPAWAEDGFGGAVALLLVVYATLFAGALALIMVAARIHYTPAALALEGASGFGAVQRSWELTRGAFLRTCGRLIAMVLLGLIPVYFVAVAVTTVVTMITLFLRILDPSPVPFGPMGLLIGAIVGSVTTALVLPFYVAFTTVMFLDQRQRSASLAQASTGWPQPPAPGQPFTPPPNR